MPLGENRMNRLSSSPRERDSVAPKEIRVSREFQRECVQFFGDVVQVMGVPRSYGQIYGLLFASPEPLCFTDLLDGLDISRGSVSQGLNALRALGAVRFVSGDGRRELFEPEKGLRKLVTGILREKVDPLVTDGARHLERLRKYAAAAPSKDGREFSLDRVQQIESWRNQMRLLLPLLKTVLATRRG